MKKYISGVVSLILVLAMLTSIMAVPSYAAEFTGKVGGIEEGVTVTKNNAPLRARPDGQDEILLQFHHCRTAAGQSALQCGFCFV